MNKHGQGAASSGLRRELYTDSECGGSRSVSGGGGTVAEEECGVGRPRPVAD
jgi:hypothetical protein